MAWLIVQQPNTSHRQQRDSPSLTQIVVVSSAAVLTIAASYYTYQSVVEYGWEGTFRYLWEGDPYTIEVRAYVMTLDEVEALKQQQETTIESIEEALERARLDCVDEDDVPDSQQVGTLWMTNLAPRNLEKMLAKLSYDLDNLAAKVDNPPFSFQHVSDSTSIKKLKVRKKLLSKQLVLDMERADALLASYDVLQKQQDKKQYSDDVATRAH